MWPYRRIVHCYIHRAKQSHAPRDVEWTAEMMVDLREMSIAQGESLRCVEG